jgi:hypothetical protein
MRVVTGQGTQRLVDRLAEKKDGCLFSRLRSAQQVTLTELAAEFTDGPPLIFGLDPLCYDEQSQLVRQIRDGRKQR